MEDGCETVRLQLLKIPGRNIANGLSAQYCSGSRLLMFVALKAKSNSWNGMVAETKRNLQWRKVKQFSEAVWWVLGAEDDPNTCEPVSDQSRLLSAAHTGWKNNASRNEFLQDLVVKYKETKSVDVENMGSEEESGLTLCLTQECRGRLQVDGADFGLGAVCSNQWGVDE